MALNIDFVYAYGKFFRSSAVVGIAKRLPKLAGMVFSNMLNGSTVYWQMVEGRSLFCFVARDNVCRTSYAKLQDLRTRMTTTLSPK